MGGGIGLKLFWERELKKNEIIQFLVSGACTFGRFLVRLVGEQIQLFASLVIKLVGVVFQYPVNDGPDAAERRWHKKPP